MYDSSLARHEVGKAMPKRRYDATAPSWYAWPTKWSLTPQARAAARNSRNMSSFYNHAFNITNVKSPLKRGK